MILRSDITNLSLCLSFHIQDVWCKHLQGGIHRDPGRPKLWHCWMSGDCCFPASIFWLHQFWFQRSTESKGSNDHYLHDMCVTLLLLEALWINSNPYHIFSFSFTFLHLLPALPICVATWIKPPLSVNMAGTLFPTAQQLPSLLVKRISSANFPFLRLTPSNELMYKANSTLNAGPQVGIVPTRLLWTAGAPSATKIHALNMGRKIYPKKCVTYFIHH